MNDLSNFANLVGSDPTPRAPRGAMRGILMQLYPDDVSRAKEAVKPAGGEIDVRRWAQADDTFWVAAETCDALVPAFYNFALREGVGPILVKTTVEVDNLLRLPDSAGAEVLAEFTEFWTLRERFLARGFLHKRGILLYGPPGSGKTATLMLMAQDIIAQGGIVCQVGNPQTAICGLTMIRKIEPNRPIIALLEDIDDLIHSYGEHSFLSLLDGEAQVDNICFVATTNYPEKLDKRIVNRPSRFDTIRYIGMPSAPARHAYLAAKEPTLPADQLAEWVAKTEGFSIAHLRELVILVQCFDRPLIDAVAQLEKMRTSSPNSADAPDKPMFGIVGGQQRKTSFGF